MKTLQINENTVQLELDEEEILIINNALNEVCHGVKINGFQSRLGREKEFVISILKNFGVILDLFDSNATTKQSNLDL